MSLPLVATVQSSDANMSGATVLLAAAEQGDSRAADQLFNFVYDELRRLAAYKMAKKPRVKLSSQRHWSTKYG